MARIPAFTVKNLKYFTEVYDDMLKDKGLWGDERAKIAAHFADVSVDCPYRMRKNILGGCNIETCPIRNAV
jgi:hypothetical protein